MAQGSFLETLLKEGGRRKRTLESTGLVGSGRYRPTPPVNIPSPQEPVVPQTSPLGDMPVSTPPEATTPVIREEPIEPTEPTTREGFNFSAKPFAPMPLQPQDDIANEETFYRRTGRMPTKLDQALIASRRELFLRNGKVPTKRELLYEVQRGLITQRDRTGVGPA